MATQRQTCNYCGARNTSVRMHSGMLECDKCWNYRKMDRPAALHWAPAGEKFLSNIDFWDMSHYLPQCGLSQKQVLTMLHGAHMVHYRSRALKDFGPEHRWDDSQREQYEEWIAAHKAWLTNNSNPDTPVAPTA